MVTPPPPSGAVVGVVLPTVVSPTVTPTPSEPAVTATGVLPTVVPAPADGDVSPFWSATWSGAGCVVVVDGAASGEAAGAADANDRAASALGALPRVDAPWRAAAATELRAGRFRMIGSFAWWTEEAFSI